MVSPPNPTESDLPEEPSDQFLELLLEMEASLHEGQTPELSLTSLAGLSAKELQQLEQSRSCLVGLYSEASSGAGQTTRVKPFTTQTPGVERSHSEDFRVESEGIQREGIDTTEYAGTCLGRFQILKGIGMGGHGAVFLARDPLLKRLIALKVPRPDILLTPSMRRRFLQEGRAAASLTHPNIVTVYESGEIGPICYLAQEYVSGKTLREWLQQQTAPCPARQAAQILMQLAEAVGYAHSQHILHRDLKPENLLLKSLSAVQFTTGRNDAETSESDPESTHQAGTADTEFVFTPKISDFGIAKSLQPEQTVETLTGGIVGTPDYMSPEQAAGQNSQVGTASDIYSLGAILYELLTLKPPFHGENSLETLHQVTTSKMPQPREVCPQIPRDLEAICQKCLQREPSARYQQGAELAEELRRFLEGRPTRARPLTFSVALLRWCRRSPGTATVSGLLGAAVLALLIVSLMYNARLSHSVKVIQSQQTALAERELLLRRRVYSEDLKNAAQAWREGNVAETQKRLSTYLPTPDQPDLRSFPWWMLWNVSHSTSRVIGRFEPGITFGAVAIDPSGKLVASGEADGVIRVRSLPEGKIVDELRGHQPGPINSINFSSHPEENLLVSASDDGTVRVWDLNSRTATQVLRGHRGWVSAAKFIGHHGEAIASGGEDRVIRIWDTRTGKLISELSGHTDTVRALVEQPETGTLFSSSEDLTVRAWDWKKAQADLSITEGKLPIPENAGWAREMALSPDGTELAGGFRSGRLVTWDVRPRKMEPRGSLVRDELLSSGIRTVKWLDDSSLVVGLGDARILLGRELQKSTIDWQSLSGHTDSLGGVEIVPERQELVSIARDGNIRYWPSESVNGRPVLTSHSPHLQGNPVWQQSTLVVATEGEIFGYRMPAASLAFHLDARNTPLNAWYCLSPDERRVMTTEDIDGQLFFSAWEVATGARVWQLPLERKYPLQGAVDPVTGRLLLCLDQELWCVDVESGRKISEHSHPLGVTNARFVPGAGFVSCCLDGKVRFWSRGSGVLLREQQVHRNSAQSLAVSSDGRLLATAGEDRMVKLWQIADGRLLASFLMKFECRDLFFTDNDQTLIAFANDELTFWSVADELELMRWTDIRLRSGICLSPDQRTIMLQDGRNVHLLRGAP